MKSCIRCLLSVSFLFFPVHCLCGAVTNGEPSKQNAGGQRGLPVEEICRRLDATVLQIRTNAYPWARSDMLVNSVKMLNRLSEVGDKSLLPYLAEKSIDAANPETVRSRAAAAYVKIADLNESVEFMQRLYTENADKTGHWRYMLNQQLLEKFDQAKQKSEVDVETSNRFYQFLVLQIQTAVYPTQAAQIDAYLTRNLPGYETSKQRAVIGDAYASSTNEWRARTFNPIKEHFDKIPPSKRVDLRSRFPGLPPLPEDKNAKNPLKIALAVGAGLAAVCAAAWITTKRRRTRNHADGQPDNPR